jgi:hypothetical protein
MNITHDIWKYYVETLCNNNEFIVGYTTVNVLNGIFFFLLTHLLLIIDVYEWPACLYKYKIEPGAKLDWNRYITSVPPLLGKTLLCVQLPESFICVKILNYRKCGYTVESLPGVFEVRVTINTHTHKL